MRKWQTVLILIVLTALLNSNAYSQRIQDPALSSGLCVNRYDIIVDGFYGYPYLMGIYLKQYLADSLGVTNSKNFNHFGVRFEYMKWKRIGLGMEYTNALLTFKYLGAGGYHKAGVLRQRLLAKFNFHFATGEKIDPYLTAGFGYANTKIYTEEPGIKSETMSLLPLAFRIGMGMRYFFTDRLGINAEVGLFGPPAQIGLSFKL